MHIGTPLVRLRAQDGARAPAPHSLLPVIRDPRLLGSPLLPPAPAQTHTRPSDGPLNLKHVPSGADTPHSLLPARQVWARPTTFRGQTRACPGPPGLERVRGGRLPCRVVSDAQFTPTRRGRRVVPQRDWRLRAGAAAELRALPGAPGPASELTSVWIHPAPMSNANFTALKLNTNKK